MPRVVAKGCARENDATRRMTPPPILVYNASLLPLAVAMDVPTPMDKLAVLMAQCAVGNQDAFAEIYRLSSAKLFAVTVMITRRRDLAEEVVQDAYVQIWRRAASFDARRGTAMTWMITIARNAALDQYRRNRREATRTDPCTDDFDDRNSSALAVDTITRNESARELSHCLDGLEPAQRRAIQLAYVMGYTHQELADRLDAPLGTVKSWIRRGLIQLKACLDR